MDSLFRTVRLEDVDIILLDLTSIPDDDGDLESVLSIADDAQIVMVTPYNPCSSEMTPFSERGYFIFEKPLQIDSFVGVLKDIYVAGESS